MSQSNNCVLIGEQSLLIQCAEILLASGQKIQLIVSSDESIINWSDKNTIRCISFQELPEVIKNLKGNVDYLFSITNLQYLSNDILSIPAKQAINFHDGPLPEYAGLNVPVWAIINGETEHGITWHEMNEQFDNGRILNKTVFPIEQDETAFTLNAKCYDAAIEGFKKLLNDILSNQLIQTEQQSNHLNYYKKCQKPTQAPLISYTSDVEDVDKLVRALNYGGYWNPVGMPKLMIGESVYIVTDAQIISDEKHHPGEIIAVDTNQISIAFDNGVVRFETVIDLKGVKKSPIEIIKKENLSVGDKLSCLTDHELSDITRLSELSCAKELKILESLTAYMKLELPYTSNVDMAYVEPDIRHHQLDINKLKFDSSKSNKHVIISLVTLFLSKLSSQEYFHVGYISDSTPDKLDDRFFEKNVPVQVRIDKKKKAKDAVNCLLPIFQKEAEDTFYAKDLLFRHPATNAGVKDYTSSNYNVIVSARKLSDSEIADYCNEIIFTVSDEGECLDIYFNNKKVSEESISRLTKQFLYFADRVSSDKECSIEKISILTDSDKESLKRLNNTAVEYDETQSIVSLFDEQVSVSPDSLAVSFGDNTKTYRELFKRSNQYANLLIDHGVAPNQCVGVLLDRSDEMIAVMMGILKSGGCYLPLDPAYPEDRIRYMINDADVKLVITQSEYTHYLTEESKIFDINAPGEMSGYSDSPPSISISPDNLAYTIYTSGSTGNPKGVMVEHKNVINFFHGMDDVISYEKGDTWLSVTSISFDISVLEIFWTLTRGLHLVVYSDPNKSAGEMSGKSRYPDINMEFSFFYWNVANEKTVQDADKYRLLLESAKYGDKNDFVAIWTPERHFHSFGGLYPNPSVTSAALSTITQQIKLRAGSCVLPLHHPIRVVEEWSVVDNLSGGRVGMAVASGWQPNDFIIKPENYKNSKQVLFDNLETVRKLWRGESVEFESPEGKKLDIITLPRPVQDELPIWVTTAGNPETYKQAAEAGAYVLTHLLGQSTEELSEKIKLYRETWKKCNHSGGGHVTLLLHTFITSDDETAKNIAREPMKDYLKSAMFLVKAAAWNFPTFKKLSEESGKTLDEYFETISDEDLDALLEFAYQRYSRTSGLIGDPENCLNMVDELKNIGVNEIGCLIDFGLNTDIVLDNLQYINSLRMISNAGHDKKENKIYTIPELLEKHDVTHFQCTPSMATMLVNDDEAKSGLYKLKQFMVGGEALSYSLASKLTSSVSGKVTNMYGPTETTIWSTTFDLDGTYNSVPIGRPISNTRIYIVDKDLQPLPFGFPGELLIAGDGVVRGYHNRKELTNDRFIEVDYTGQRERVYRTGDLAKYREDGVIEYLGRIDNQVKLRGYRIELGEIESLIQQFESINACVVVLREDTPGDKRLVAYIQPKMNQKPGIKDIKEKLKSALPDFMLPSEFVVLSVFPLTPNGKIDRKSLPAPSSENKITSRQEAKQPENKLQEKISAIWKDVLNLEEIGITDNFFDIGGHSLLVIQILEKIRNISDKNIKMTDMFKYPTIRLLSDYLDSDDNDVNESLASGQARAEKRKSAASRRRRLKQK